MSRRGGAKDRAVPLIGDSVHQRVYRYVSFEEATNLVNARGYEWIDVGDPDKKIPPDPTKGLRIPVHATVMRPQIGSTITFTELMINAGVATPCEARVQEVREKIAQYKLTDPEPVLNYCPWPRDRVIDYSGIGMTGEQSTPVHVSSDVREHWHFLLGKGIGFAPQDSN